MTKKNPKNPQRSDENTPYPKETVPPSEIREAAMSSNVYGDAVGSPSEFIPKTSLGQELLAIRERVIAAGEPLLSLDEIQDEIDSRRGHRIDI